MTPKTQHTSLASLLTALVFVTTANLGEAESSAVVERTISSSRVTMKDIVPTVPTDLAAIDLGPAPAPGATRQFAKYELCEALPLDRRAECASFPEAVRLVRKTAKLSVKDIEKLAREGLTNVGLPRGATIAAVRPSAGVTVADGFDHVVAQVPKPPRRQGKLETSAMVVLSHGTEELARIAVPVELTLGPEAAIPDVKKGGSAILVVRRGLVEIRANVSALADVDVGETVQVSVSASGKTMRGKLILASPATFEEVP
ncbi:MAG: flagella basal body P-ring formation protein FlgA [Polyangiaceae bacterium]